MQNRILTSRTHFGSFIAALVVMATWSLPALADRTVNAVQPVVISDDILERTTAVESASSESTSSSTPDGSGGSESGDSSGDGGTQVASGHDNNGHGNNLDGVDSSNPSQGHGGPNGQTDLSCDGSGACVDDEAGGGSGNGNSGNGNSGNGNSGNGNH